MSNKKLFFLLIISIALTGCRSSRNAAGDGSTSTVSADGTSGATPIAGSDSAMRTQPVVPAPLQYVTGKLDFTARKNGKNSASVGGSIKMGRNEIIQLSLVYFIVEIGRLEITPEYILVIDKYNSRYIRKAWADLPYTDGLGYDAVEKFFWGEYPMQGNKSLSIPLSNNITLELSYLEWTEIEGRKFPEKMQLTILAGRQSFAGIFSYSNLKAPSKLGNIKTKVSSSYREAELSEIIKLFSGAR
ncbi:MAG: DUF4292 domain-containing protein [Bacteroidaceae bacterium]|nr:DUF4292 domain-containing protein [Bacteroidaceae bacterium]